MLTKIFEGKIPGITSLNLRERENEWASMIRSPMPPVHLPDVELFKNKVKMTEDKGRSMVDTMKPFSQNSLNKTHLLMGATGIYSQKSSMLSMPKGKVNGMKGFDMKGFDNSMKQKMTMLGGMGKGMGMKSQLPVGLFSSGKSNKATSMFSGKDDKIRGYLSMPQSPQVKGKVKKTTEKFSVASFIRGHNEHVSKFLSSPVRTDTKSFFRIGQQKGLDMFGDADKDGVVNILDCDPFNKKRQGPDDNVYGELGIADASGGSIPTTVPTSVGSLESYGESTHSTASELGISDITPTSEEVMTDKIKGLTGATVEPSEYIAEGAKFMGKEIPVTDIFGGNKGVGAAETFTAFTGGTGAFGGNAGAQAKVEPEIVYAEPKVNLGKSTIEGTEGQSGTNVDWINKELGDRKFEMEKMKMQYENEMNMARFKAEEANKLYQNKLKLAESSKGKGTAKAQQDAWKYMMKAQADVWKAKKKEESKKKEYDEFLGKYGEVVRGFTGGMGLFAGRGFPMMAGGLSGSGEQAVAMAKSMGGTQPLAYKTSQLLGAPSGYYGEGMRIAKSMAGPSSLAGLSAGSKIEQFTAMPGKRPQLPQVSEVPVEMPQMQMPMPTPQPMPMPYTATVPGVYEEPQQAQEGKVYSSLSKRVVKYPRGPYKKRQPQYVQQ